MRPAKQGDSKTTEVPVEKAFGPYLEERVVGVPKNTFARWGPEPVTGERAPIPQRNGPSIDAIVTEVTESKKLIN